MVAVKGPKGALSQSIDPSIKVSIENGVITLEENPDILQDNPKQRHAFHGLYRALVNNMVVGVSEGYKKEMEVVGVGYRVSNQGNVITFELLHSHSIVLVLPAEIKVETKSERNKNPRSFRKPEPYKGKGIKFVDEVLRRKSGKSAAAK